MTIQEYARAVAEAVLMVCEESGLPDMDAEDVRESLSDIIASVPRPTAQHHDAPTPDIDPDEVRQQPLRGGK
jgi:hypothetical protein